MLFADMMPGDGEAPRLATRADALAVLRRQHDDLHGVLARLPRLEGAAREDEFLQARRHLAVHQALLDRLFPTSDPAGPGARGVDEQVLVAERLTASSTEFGTAIGRVLGLLLRQHEELPGSSREGARPLAAAERALVQTAEALWLGEGHAYLGNDYREMLAAARAQLDEASTGIDVRGA